MNNGTTMTRSNPRKPRLTVVQQILSEQVIYGGMIATRREVYSDCLSRLNDQWTADWFAMRSPLATEKEIQHLPNFKEMLASGKIDR